MPSNIDYALMSTRVYAASDDNKTGVPKGWKELKWQSDSSASGFSAGAYRLGREVVIAYTGTNDHSLDWLAGNSAWLGLLPAPQVFDAMRFYLDIKAANPDATSFTFTGHSLGGGLASLMSVFFNKPAVVFDEAPFQYTAINPLILSSLEASLLLSGYTDLDFALYNASFGMLFPFREGNVRHTFLDGEILDKLRGSLSTIAGRETAISMGTSTLSDLDRHSMTLLAGMVSNTTFKSVVQQLPNFATYLLDPAWFGVTDRRSPDKIDLMSSLLRSQYGVDGVTADGRLDRFAIDMEKLVGSTDNNLKDALLKIALQKYFNSVSVPFDKEFFDKVCGGLRFDLSGVTLGNAQTAHDNLKTWLKTNAPTEAADSLGNLDAYQRFTLALDKTLTPESPADDKADFMFSGAMGGNLADKQITLRQNGGWTLMAAANNVKWRKAA